LTVGADLGSLLGWLAMERGSSEPSWHGSAGNWRGWPRRRGWRAWPRRAWRRIVELTERDGAEHRRRILQRAVRIWRKRDSVDRGLTDDAAGLVRQRMSEDQRRQADANRARILAQFEAGEPLTDSEGTVNFPKLAADWDDERGRVRGWEGLVWWVARRRRTRGSASRRRSSRMPCGCSTASRSASVRSRS
jgi:hypothetical protein